MHNVKSLMLYDGALRDLIVGLIKTRDPILEYQLFFSDLKYAFLNSLKGFIIMSLLDIRT